MDIMISAFTNRVAALLFFMALLIPAEAMSAVLTSDTTWSGEVVVEEDILVPEGVTLTILPGARVRVTASESTKTDPEFMSPLTEITVRGTLVANGVGEAPITFSLAGDKKHSWAGIIIDGGKAMLRYAVVSDAETGIYVVNGFLSLKDSQLTKNRYGLTIQGPRAEAHVSKSRVEKNDYGVLLLNGAEIDAIDTSIAENRKKDRYSPAARNDQPSVVTYAQKDPAKGITRTYGDEVLLGTTVWQGRIAVHGVVRIPENARLVILPGTVVEFGKKDTNRDNIGENGLQIQGQIIAKGTRELPILFRSAEKQREMGDWDSINIMNSDKARNLIEHCRIEDAYRGLHFHFSNVSVLDVVLTNNYRGIQFQESVVEITRAALYENKSAVQARDSEIIFSDNAVHHNYSGINFFRNSLAVRGNTIANNYQEGIRVREGLPVIERNLIDGNRQGLMVNDSLYGTFSMNVISHNLESGISLRNTNNIEIRGNVVQANGLNGINIQDAGAVIRGNLISDNRERGIGVQSFQGNISDNTIVRNGLYNLGIDGPADVTADMNWWGEGDVKKMIFDKENDPSRGKANYLPMRQGPILFSWPLSTMRTDAAWHGDMAVNESLTVDPGVNLVVAPKTRVYFSAGTGLVVKGKMLARGEQNAMISFASSQGKGPGEWDEILLDHALGSEFVSCLFSNATWALHSHFTDLKVEGSAFVNNQGGIRFTSGPIEVRSSYFGGNEVAIRAFRGSARISGNVITGNSTGIFVREKGGGLAISKNNIFANSGYNLRMGDFNSEDVDAKDNWWGDALPPAKIFDARNEPGIGTVRYEPIADTPFAVELPAPLIGQTRMQFK